MDLAKLNVKYYHLFNDLFDASPALPERHYTTVAKVLEQQYLEELDICLTEIALTVGVKNFELKFRAKNYLPRRVWLRWNKMAKALLSDYKAEFKEFLDNWTINKKSQHVAIENVQDDEQLKEVEITALTVAKENTVIAAKGSDDDTNG